MRDFEFPVSIWNDARFTALSSGEQVMYFLLGNHSDIVGLGRIMPNRFAYLTNTSPVDALGCIRGLAIAEWIDIDERFDEYFIRDAIQFSRVHKLPNVLRSADERAWGYMSPIIRRGLADQLSSIDRDDAQRAAGRIIDGTRQPRHRSNRRKIHPAVRLAVYERDNWQCLYCGQSFAPVGQGSAPEDQELGIWLELDHVKPYSLDGDDSEGNLRSACSTCNRKRGVDDADLWGAIVGKFDRPEGGDQNPLVLRG